MFCAACGRTFAKLAEFDKHRNNFRCDPTLGEDADSRPPARPGSAGTGALARTGGQGTILPQIAAERHAAGCGLEQFGATPVHCAKCEHEGSAA